MPVHLIIQTMMVGTGSLLLIGLMAGLAAPALNLLAWIFGLTVVIDLFVTLFGEFGMPHASDVAAKAAHQISHGKYRHHFWRGSVLLGHVLPLLLLLAIGVGSPLSLGAIAVAVLANIAGLYLFEYAFVLAPQEIPNS